MKSQVILPEMKVRTEVIPGAAKKPQCIGCLNISKSKWPISFYSDTGLARIDTESQWIGLDGERLDSIALNFCPVCGRSIPWLEPAQMTFN